MLESVGEVRIIDAVTWRILPLAIMRYGQGLFIQLIARCHDEGEWEPGVNPRNFPIPIEDPAHEFQPALLTFGRKADARYVLEYASAHELLDPDPEHTLKVAGDYPALQMTSSVVAVAADYRTSRSVWRGRSGGNGVIVLGRRGSKRQVYVGFYGAMWGEKCQFLFLMRKTPLPLP